jgi:hypothetical protein
MWVYRWIVEQRTAPNTIGVSHVPALGKTLVCGMNRQTGYVASARGNNFREIADISGPVPT